MATILAFNGPVAPNTGATNSLSVPGTAMGSIVTGSNSPPATGASPNPSIYLAPWIRFQPAAPLANGNNVVDLVMPTGPNHPEAWYAVVYTYSSGTGLLS
jgi:hypothetical protein